MQLLSPSQTRDQKEDENARSILRTQELRELEREQRISLAKAEADFQSLLVSQRQRMEREETSHAARVADMQKEIALLEAEKLNTLIPFAVLKEGTEERMTYATDYLKGLRQREADVETRMELLEDKLDGVTETERHLADRASELDRKQYGMNQQAQLMKESNTTLTRAIADFAAEKLAGEADIRSRTQILAEKEKAGATQEAFIASETERLEVIAKRLADERGVLDRAFAEVRRMKQASP